MLKNIGKTINKFASKLPKIKLSTVVIFAIVIALSIYILLKVEQFCVLGIVGDCTTKSVTKVEDISENIMQIDASIRQSVTQSCLNSSSASNVVNIIDSNLTNASISQQNILKNVCVLKSAFDSSVSLEAQQKLAAAIAQYAKSKGGFMGAPASSEAVTESITKSAQEIDSSQVFNSVKNCVNNLDLDNVINIINSNVTSTSIDQINNSFFECLANDSTTTAIAVQGKQEQEKQIDQKAESESVDVISSLFTGFNILIIGIGLVLVLGLFIGGKALVGVLDTEAAQELTSSEAVQKGFGDYLSQPKSIPQNNIAAKSAAAATLPSPNISSTVEKIASSLTPS